MPRVYCSETNDPYDYCIECWKYECHVDHMNGGGGPIVIPDELLVIKDNHGYPHPNYVDCNYQCELCLIPLKEKDN